MIPLFSYMAFPAIFIFVIGHVATATLPLPKPKLSRKIRIIKFGNHSKTTSKRRRVKRHFLTLLLLQVI